MRGGARNIERMSSDESGRRGFLKAGIAVTVAAGTSLVNEAVAGAQDKGAPAEKEGTLLRGPDGKLYFVPDEALKAYALDDKKTSALESRFGEGLKAAAVTLPGKEVVDSGVGALKIKNVLLVNVGSLRTGAVSLKALPSAPSAPGAYKVTPQPPTKR